MTKCNHDIRNRKEMCIICVLDAELNKIKRAEKEARKQGAKQASVEARREELIRIRDNLPDFFSTSCNPPEEYFSEMSFKEYIRKRLKDIAKQELCVSNDKSLELE